MSPEEAIWIGRELARINDEKLSPLINLGSSTAEYRTRAAPHIEKYIFGPLRDRGVEVLHLDLKEGEGVDIVGSIFDERVQRVVDSLPPRSIMCNNLLEHVSDRERFCEICLQLLRPGGYLLVSAPSKYPYHPDPIDTGFRPSLVDLEKMFSPLKLVRGDTICFGNYFGQLREKKWLVLRDAYLALKSPLSGDARRVLLGNYSFLFRSYRETCAVFRKKEV